MEGTQTEDKLIEQDKLVNESKSNGTYDRVQSEAALRQQADMPPSFGAFRGFGAALALAIASVMALSTAQPADAGIVVGTTPNSLGGEVMFLDDSCPGTRLNVAIMYDKQGRNVFGCWTYNPATGNVVVDWGDVFGMRAYPLSIVKPTPESLIKYPPQPLEPAAAQPQRFKSLL